MKIFSFASTFVLVILLAFSVKVNATGTEAYYITTNPGEDMSTEININWHSDIEGTYLEYTLASDTNYTSATRVDPECKAFSVADSVAYGSKTIVSSGFSERNQCQVSLTGLTPDTEYMYRVGKTTFSGNYYFKTAQGVAPFSFLYMTDPQYASLSGASIFNNLMTKALEIDNDIRLSIFSGDVVDRGGKIEQWDMLFQQSNLKSMPIAVVPGNHEYYDASGTPQVFDATYYNGFYNNPDNGAEGVKNSSYFFKYNNVLFIGIDSEAAAYNPTLWAAQKEWFGNVVEGNHAQYIVVFQHRSFYGSQYASVSPAQRDNWQPIFDKYGVDLVVTGHDHVYTRTKSIYQGVESTDPRQGTVYLIGGSAGAKYYGVTPNHPFGHLFEKTFEKQTSAQIFSVDASGLHLKTISTTGTILDEVTILAKRGFSIANTFDKDEYMDSITLKSDSSDITKATFNWGSKGYGYVNSVKLVNDNGDEYGLDYINNNYQTNLEITGLAANELYEYTLKVDFKDGTALEKPIVLSTKQPFGQILSVYIDDSNLDNVTLNWIAFLENDQVSKFNIYVNDVFYQEAAVDDVSLQLVDLNKYHLNEIRFEAIDIYDDVVYSETLNYGEEAAPVEISYSSSELELTVGDSDTPTLTINPDQALDLVYSSSNTAVATVDANGRIVAKSVGEAIITVSVKYRSDVTTSITVNVVEEEDPNDDDPIIDDDNQDDDETPAKKGCSLFGSSIATFSFLSLLGVVIVLRRRK